MLLSRDSQQAAGPLDWQYQGEVLEFESLPPFDSSAIQAKEWSLWRYAAMLPVECHVSLGEGMTPLVQTEIAGIPIWVKLEYLNPTGSYKDRGTTVLVNHLLAQDVREVIEDSSGNAGASLAAFTAAGGIKARIFTPADAPTGKKRLIAAFGAELVEIPGPRAATTAASLQAAESAIYASHAWSPYFVVGQMTCAWEIWEQIGVPDAVVCCVGQGGLFLGLARGFKALLDAGLIARLPRFYAVQSVGCDPIARAWEQNQAEPVIVEQLPSVADGIAVTAPVRGREVLSVLRETGGAAVRVDDAAILSAQAQLHRQGFIIEPTSAVPAAALPQIQARFERGDKILMPLTGNGLKTIL